MNAVALDQGEEAVVSRLGGVLFRELFVDSVLASCADWMSAWKVSCDLASVSEAAPVSRIAEMDEEPGEVCKGLEQDAIAYLMLKPRPRHGALVVPVAGGAPLVLSGVASRDPRWSQPGTALSGLRVHGVAAVSEDGARCAVLRDACQMARRLSEAEAVRTVDSDTGLMNKAAFLAAIEQAIARNRRDGKPFTVALLDVDCARDASLGDGAESLNVLRYTARALAGTVRREDFVARIGPARFACLFLGGNGQEAPAALNRIQRNLRRAGIAEAQGVRVLVGAATCHQSVSSPIEALNNAEIMLSLEKERDRPRMRS